jgi:hypothetical protein
MIVTFRAMIAGSGRRTWSWAAAAAVAAVVSACGSAGQTTTRGGPRQPAKAGSPASAHEAAVTHADGTATVPAGVTSSSLPHGWTGCAATATQDAGAASPTAPGCRFVRAAETQVQELLRNEGSTVFNTPETIGVTYRRQVEQLVNCTAQHDGPTIVCADNGVPWALIFRPPGQ